MPLQAILAAIVFVGLFVAWVIMPTQLKKRHAEKTENET